MLSPVDASINIFDLLFVPDTDQFSQLLLDCRQTTDFGFYAFISIEDMDGSVSDKVEVMRNNVLSILVSVEYSISASNNEFRNGIAGEYSLGLFDSRMQHWLLQAEVFDSMIKKLNNMGFEQLFDNMNFLRLFWILRCIQDIMKESADVLYFIFQGLVCRHSVLKTGLILTSILPDTLLIQLDSLEILSSNLQLSLRAINYLNTQFPEIFNGCNAFLLMQFIARTLERFISDVYVWERTTAATINNLELNVLDVQYLIASSIMCVVNSPLRSNLYKSLVITDKINRSIINIFDDPLDYFELHLFPGFISEFLESSEKVLFHFSERAVLIWLLDIMEWLNQVTYMLHSFEGKLVCNYDPIIKAAMIDLNNLKMRSRELLIMYPLKNLSDKYVNNKKKAV